MKAACRDSKSRTVNFLLLPLDESRVTQIHGTTITSLFSIKIIYAFEKIKWDTKHWFSVLWGEKKREREENQFICGHSGPFEKKKKTHLIIYINILLTDCHKIDWYFSHFASDDKFFFVKSPCVRNDEPFRKVDGWSGLGQPLIYRLTLFV